jgi:hypothetical protein
MLRVDQIPKVERNSVITSIFAHPTYTVRPFLIRSSPCNVRAGVSINMITVSTVSHVSDYGVVPKRAVTGLDANIVVDCVFVPPLSPRGLSLCVCARSCLTS